MNAPVQPAPDLAPPATEPFDVPLTLQRLTSTLSYDPESGIFRWLVTLGNKAPAGKRAGSIDQFGYRTIKLDQRDYRAARLVFFYVTGQWPVVVVDHINGDRADDRLCNLRQATFTQNSANSKQRSDQQFYKGVSYHKKARRWSAKIQSSGVSFHLGLFDTAEDAAIAYQTAANQKFGAFVRAS